MKPFRFVRAADVAGAVEAARGPDASVIAGGTTLVDLMRLEVMQPGTVVDVTRLPLAAIEPRPGGIRIGALARNSDVARHPAVAEAFPVLAEAILAGASPQVRNMATVGGNLLQRTRCPYFRDLAVSACNKRQPGSGCAALEGYARSHAVLGTSDRCIATHPSDMCVALAALDAVVHVRGPSGERRIAIGDFHTLPGDHPEVETTLAPGELIVAVDVPTSPAAQHSRYVKVRDRAAFAFAVASAAVGLEVAGGVIRAARIALGGIATKPWRAPAAEAALVGQRPGREAYRRAADAALADARPRGDNGFKVELAKRTLVRALALVGGAR